MHIVWHHKDLRVQDNPALDGASSEQVIPLYIHCPEEEEEWPRGEASNWWLHHSLQSLDQTYREKGGKLLIRKGKALDVLKALCEEFPITAIYWNQRYEPALRSRDREVAEVLSDQGIEIRRFEGNYLITPTQVLNKSGKPYCVFTPFSKTVIGEKRWREPLRAPRLKFGPSLDSDKLDLLPSLDWADDFPKYWQPGREGALKLLKNIPKGYDENRNFPAIEGTSRLSPHLHFGEVSPHEVWDKSHDQPEFQRQLIWREFGNYFLFHFPLSQNVSWRSKFEKFPWRYNKTRLAAWQRGETGYPIVDAGMRQLWETGWMHNRVRMIVGSFLIKDLGIHWLDGAKWFWDTLVDADLANNTLGWQWVAGCGPDAAPYFRIFNPVLQGKKFDPEGEYVRRWIPELAKVPKKWIHEPWAADIKIEGYPDPIVNHAEARDKALEAFRSLNDN